MLKVYGSIFPMPLVCAAFCVSSKANLDLQQEFGLSWKGFTKNEALFCVRLKLTTTYTPQEERFPPYLV